MIMSAHIQSPRYRQQRSRWWQALKGWRRTAVVIILLGALVISAGLIYVGVEIPIPPAAVSVAPVGTATPGPLYPPGTDEYWYWGQGQPLIPQP